MTDTMDVEQIRLREEKKLRDAVALRRRLASMTGSEDHKRDLTIAMSILGMSGKFDPGEVVDELGRYIEKLKEGIEKGGRS